MLKNLKSLFIVDEEESQVKNDKGTSTAKDNSKNPSVEKEASSIATTNSVSGNVDNKIVEKLLGAIEKNNIDGFDYLEYKKSLKALDKLPMDEATKYRSAFATASTMDITLDKLIETANYYVGILHKESEQFTTAFKNQFDSKVSGKEKEVEEFRSIIQRKSEQIKQLTEEITKHQNQIQELKTQIEESSLKITKTQNDFNKSYESLKVQFEDDILKMKKYLK